MSLTIFTATDEVQRFKNHNIELGKLNNVAKIFIQIETCGIPFIEF